MEPKWSELLSLPVLLSPFKSDCVKVGVRGLLLYGLSLRLNHNYTIIEVRQLLNSIFMYDKHISVFEAADTLN